MSSDEIEHFLSPPHGKCSLCGTRLRDDECRKCGASQIEIAKIEKGFFEKSQELGGNRRLLFWSDKYLLPPRGFSKLAEDYSEELWSLTNQYYRDKLIDKERKRQNQAQKVKPWIIAIEFVCFVLLYIISLTVLDQFLQVSITLIFASSFLSSICFIIVLSWWHGSQTETPRYERSIPMQLYYSVNKRVKSTKDN